ncbi:hypothetical protein ACFV8T_34970 [Streptomyces sp. NPDC059832]
MNDELDTLLTALYEAGVRRPYGRRGESSSRPMADRPGAVGRD